MGEKNVEPDAYRMKSTSMVYEEERWEIEAVQPDGTVGELSKEMGEPLYSSETIKEIIQEMKEEMGEKPSGLDKLNRNSWKERLKTLEELQQVFDSE